MSQMNRERSKYDYGTCHVCGAPIRERMVKQDFWLKGRLVVIEDVPAGVCTQCGQKVVRAAVGRQIAGLISDQRGLRTSRSLKVPVIRLARKVA
jgi:HTH-type transcriptional regulator/antitoxin MqsA